jgi:hypothetical protein
MPANVEHGIHRPGVPFLPKLHGLFYTASDEGVRTLLSDAPFLQEFALVFALKPDTRYFKPAQQSLGDVCFIPVPGSDGVWPDCFQLLLYSAPRMELVLFGKMKSTKAAPITFRYQAGRRNILATKDANGVVTGHLQNPSQDMCVVPLRGPAAGRLWSL